MGQKLLEQMVPALEKMSWSGEDRPTAQGQTAYKIGLARVNSYGDDTKELAAALRIFQSGQSRPFAFAGVAYTLLAVAREADGSYAAAGLDAALHWLEKAQALAPDVVDINFIEALIYTYGERFDDAGLILDYLAQQEPDSNYLLEARIAFHQRQGQIDDVIPAYEAAIARADSTPDKLDWQNKLADCYLEFNRLPEALELYREVVRFNRENALLWHKISLIYYRLQNFEEAVYANEKAVTLGSLPEATQMAELLKKHKDSGGIFGRLLGK